MADQSEIISQFMATTGATAENAQFFLESAGWDLSRACDNFFDNGNVSEEPALAAPTGSKNSSSSSRGVKTMAEILAGQSAGNDDEDEGQDYFAGGEKSGVMMKGGPKKKLDGEKLDLVQNILKQAAEAGPPPSDFEKQTKKPKTFTGTGFRLGSEAAESSAPVPVAQSEDEDDADEVVERHLTFWKNGFSIDDGELKSYDDPANQEFLKAIHSGRAPTQFLNVKYGQPVEVKVSQKMEEMYKPPPKKPVQAFSGAGMRLGSLPSASSSSAPPPVTPAQSITIQQVSVDETQPVTSIQIRLGDGTRLVAKFNHTHTVNDIRSFINASRAGEASRNYILQTSFPVKALNDGTATLKDAGLLNAVILQRYT